ncbi:hypothetical protein ACHAPJ_001145 [Fusarium lateritium]
MYLLFDISLDLPYALFPRSLAPPSNCVADVDKDNAFFLGQAPKFLQVSWFPELFCKWSREFPEAPLIRYLNFANGETLFVNSIEAYKQVLQTKSASFVKPAFAREFAHEIIGDGLPFVEGKLHKLRRAAISQPFSRPRVKSFFPTVQRKAEQLIGVLTERRNENGNVEVETNIWKAVLDVIGLETFGLDLNHLESDESPLFDTFTRMMHPSVVGHVVNYLNSIVPIRQLVPIKECIEFTQSCTRAREFIVGLVAIRRKWCEQSQEKQAVNRDALQCLLEHSDSSWNDKNIVEYRLRDEIISLDSTCATPDFDDIDKLPYLHNFVREVLRLYCAVAMAPRQATQDVEIAGVMIPQGTVIQLSPAVMNTHPSIWGPTAQEFDPDRWNDLTGDVTSAYAFETFHNGPRMCIGKQLSIMEMKVMLVEMVRRFRVEKPFGTEDKPVEVAGPTFTLRPKDKLVVRLVEV